MNPIVPPDLDQLAGQLDRFRAVLLEAGGQTPDAGLRQELNRLSSEIKGARTTLVQSYPKAMAEADQLIAAARKDADEAKSFLEAARVEAATRAAAGAAPPTAAPAVMPAPTDQNLGGRVRDALLHRFTPRSTDLPEASEGSVWRAHSDAWVAPPPAPVKPPTPAPEKKKPRADDAELSIWEEGLSELEE